MAAALHGATKPRYGQSSHFYPGLLIYDPSFVITASSYGSPGHLGAGGNSIEELQASTANQTETDRFVVLMQTSKDRKNARDEKVSCIAL